MRIEMKNDAWWWTTDKSYVAYLMLKGYKVSTIAFKERKGKIAKCFIFDYPKDELEEVVSGYITSEVGEYMRILNELTTRINQTGTVDDLELLNWINKVE